MDQDFVQVVVENQAVEADARRRHLKVRLTIGLIVLVLVATTAGILWGSYASASESCAPCHTEIHTQVGKSFHNDLECGECHVSKEVLSKTRFGATVLFGMRLHWSNPTKSVATEVPRYRCSSCHDDLSGVVGNTLKINHEQCAPQQNCVSCHSQVAHRAENSSLAMDMFDCLTCHNTMNTTAACDTCHDGRVPKDRLKSGSFAVTHGIDWQRTHGMGNMAACSACHLQADCGKCHGVGVPHGYNFSVGHGQYGKSKDADCKSCHLDAFCGDCHAMDMPHPNGFKERHSTEVESVGRGTCLSCHAESDCQTCHTMHIHPGGSVGSRDGL